MLLLFRQRPDGEPFFQSLPSSSPPLLCLNYRQTVSIVLITTTTGCTNRPTSLARRRRQQRKGSQVNDCDKICKQYSVWIKVEVDTSTVVSSAKEVLLCFVHFLLLCSLHPQPFVQLLIPLLLVKCTFKETSLRDVNWTLAGVSRGGCGPEMNYDH